MLSRRIFSGCLVCAGMELIATGAGAQAPAAASGISRVVLGKQDLPGTNYECIQIIGTIDAGAVIARHTHPGIESTIVIEGGGTLLVKGAPDRAVKPMDGFLIPPEAPHGLRNGPQPTRIATTYTVERGKPLVTPAPE